MTSKITIKGKGETKRGIVTENSALNIPQHLAKQWGAIPLPAKRVGIVIPSTINVYEQIGYVNTGILPEKYALTAPNEYINAIKTQVYNFLGQFGGFTQSEQFGGWIDTTTKQQILEPGQFVWAYGTPNIEQLDYIGTLAQAIKGLLKQDSVLILVEDLPYLI